MTNHLESLARRVEGDPFFLASALKDYAQSEGLDDDGVAKALGCTKETLNLLRLCRTPDPARFNEDIEQIAARFQVSRDALAQAVRRGHALVQLRRRASSDHGMLLAAQDGDDPQNTPEPRGDSP